MRGTRSWDTRRDECVQMMLYICGPMRGRPGFNREGFRMGTERLRKQGHRVFSPWEHTHSLMGKNGFELSGDLLGTEDIHELSGVPLGRLIADDLSFICQYAEGLVALEGWEHSDGTLLELHAAALLAKPAWALSPFLAFGPNAPRLSGIPVGQGVASTSG